MLAASMCLPAVSSMSLGIQRSKVKGCFADMCDLSSDTCDLSSDTDEKQPNLQNIDMSVTSLYRCYGVDCGVVQIQVFASLQQQTSFPTNHATLTYKLMNFTPACLSVNMSLWQTLCFQWLTLCWMSLTQYQCFLYVSIFFSLLPLFLF